jgi:uncharacterized protein
MRQRSRALAFACGFVIGVLASLSLQSSVHAQSADLALCDRVAADPADPDKPSYTPGTTVIAQTDIALAIRYCRQAAASSRRALYELGRAYAVSNRWSDAVAAYRKAADKGSTAAMVALGTMYENGSGVAKDDTQARALFQRAASAGNPVGVADLAALSSATGAALDPVQERAMLTNAAEANSADAQFQLGLMYANGIGGPKDDVEARSWFEKAAAQGNADALDWMGSFSASGRGGPRDINAAKDYYEKAAAAGNDDAKAELKRLECSIVMRDKHGNVIGCM